MKDGGRMVSERQKICRSKGVNHMKVELWRSGLEDEASVRVSQDVREGDVEGKLMCLAFMSA